MKYLKSFSYVEQISLTSEMVGELRDFCRNRLAYLMDEGFVVQVNPTFNGTKCDISIFKSDHRSSTSWLLIKDYIIPFLYMLNREYKIIGSDYDETHNFIDIHPDMVVGDIFDDDKRIDRRIKIRVDFKDINEGYGKSDLDELTEFCNDYLSYLLDDDYDGYC